MGYYDSTTVLRDHAPPGDFIVRQEIGGVGHSIEGGTLAPTAVALPAGQVLGIVTASGQWAPYNPSASDGTQKAEGLLHAYAYPSTGTQRVAIVVRCADVMPRLLTGLDAAARLSLASESTAVRRNGHSPIRTSNGSGGYDF